MGCTDSIIGGRSDVKKGLPRSERQRAVNQVWRRESQKCSKLWGQDTIVKRRESARQVFLGPKSFHSSRMENEEVGVASQESEETNLFKHRRS